MSDDLRLQRMLDEHEIRNLAQRYAVAITTADVDALPELFDPEVDNGPFGTGRDGVRAYYEDYFRRNQRHAHHVGGTHQIDLIDEETATGICLIRSWTGMPGEGWMDVMVVYYDTYRKRDGRWGFVQRRETLHDIVPGTDHADPQVGKMPRAWDYWHRWQERKANNQLFR